ncbi:MAG: hypothetical protein DHS20C19_28410 [Acidimicrobiales bacterium]|nr:MAG: hypothetical protein DHS20C19_28410 [Acidimicrobiales bacterium]
MAASESTRLRIRQYLIELMDEEAADAMMESMPPMHWDQLATKDDIARLDGRIDGLSERIGGLGVRMDAFSERMDTFGERMDTFGERMDMLGERMDTFGERIDGVHQSLTLRMGDMATDIRLLGRAVTIGAATIAVTLAVFMIGTIASLIAAGAFS